MIQKLRELKNQLLHQRKMITQGMGRRIREATVAAIAATATIKKLEVKKALSVEDLSI
jgi:hypothetical protein